MCQLFCITAHDPAKRDEIIERVWSQMALTQKDGYGAAWFSPDGTIGFHKRRYPRLIETEATLPFVKDKAKPADIFSLSNDIPSDGGFLIIHGRLNSPKAPISLANTHPFMTETDNGRSVALIHNGLVTSWTYDNVLPGCSCDSELLMHAYADGGIDGVENHTDGRYAFMFLEYTPPTADELAANPAAVGTKRLHVAKDAAAMLYAGETKEKNIVIATTETLLAMMKAESAGELKNHVLILFDNKDQYQMTEFKPINYNQKEGYQNWWQKWRKTEASTPKVTTSFPDDDDPVSKQVELELSAQEKKEIELLEQQALDYAV